MADDSDDNTDTNNTTDKKIQESVQTQNETLTSSKDRAQLTATGAMSIVNIALLREVLDRGPEGNPYFMPHVCLIGISFSLQVLAGLLAIMVTNMTNYYNKYQDFLFSEFTENMCCCRIVRKVKTKTVAYGLNYPLTKPPECTQPDSGQHLMQQSTVLMIPDVMESEDDDTRQGCCPCNATMRVLEEYEYVVLQRLRQWTSQQTELEEKAAMAQVQVQYLTDIINSSMQKVTQLALNRGTYASAEDFERDKEAILEQNRQAKAQKKYYKEILRSLEISRAQGEILRKRVQTIFKAKIFKMATFWQQGINYIFYLVFVMNAFIVGLTYAQPDLNASGGMEEASAATTAAVAAVTQAATTVAGVVTTAASNVVAAATTAASAAANTAA